MKTRIISSLVGLVLLAVVLAYVDTLLLNAVIGAIGVIAVLELLGAAGIRKFRGLTALTLVLAASIPFARVPAVRAIFPQLMFVYILLFFVLLLKNHTVMHVEHAAMAFLFGTFVPVFFSCGVYIRDDFGPVRGGFYLLLALGAAWLCDTCAYFTGLRFGRRKLAPQISPKKTVEGAIGGVVLGTLCMLLLAAGFAAVMQAIGITVQVHYLPLALVTPLLNIIGMMGDLCASVIKRQFGVKDYGHIMPGHGGIMDRFDSVLFTLPAVFVLMQHIVLLSL